MNGEKTDLDETTALIARKVLAMPPGALPPSGLVL